MFPVVSDLQHWQHKWKHRKVLLPNAFLSLFPMFPIPILKIVSKEKEEKNACIRIYTQERVYTPSETAIGNNSGWGTAVTDVISSVTLTRYRLITISTIGNSIVITKKAFCHNRNQPLLLVLPIPLLKVVNKEN